LSATIFVCVFCTSAYADNEDDFEQDLGISAVYDSAPDTVKEISGKLITDGTYDCKGAVSRLTEKLIGEARTAVDSMISQFAELTVIALLSSLCISFSDDKISRYIPIIACGACVILSLDSVNGVLIQAEKAIDEIKAYSNAVLPALFVSSAASGSIVSAPAKYAAVSLSMDVITTVSHDVCKPIIKAFLALGISGEISGNRLMINMTKLAKWSSITILTLMTLGFTTYINFVGAISSSADAAAVKAAKTVISTALPVVGGIVSDAASAVLSAALLIKSSAGIFALIVTSALSLVPFVSCAVKMFIFKIVSAIAEGLGEPKLSAILNTIGTSVGLYCALLGSTGIMLFISISSSLKAFSG